MAENTVTVVNPGLATTIQDLGRPGYYQLGFPQGGAMDRFALRAANLLVGNDEGAAGLETPYMGPELRFDRDATVAVTGADVPVLVDGEEQPGWTALRLRQGQTLSFGLLRGGARIYIAVDGGFDVPQALGSRSTYVIGQIGGFEGRPLAAGDCVPLGAPLDSAAGASVPADLRRSPGKPAELRVLPGLYWHRVVPASGERFFQDEWLVGTEADRMGYRFRGGEPLELVPREPPFGAGADPSNIVDSAYPYGSIQVPAGQEPIVLHRDAVSAGGYFQIGAVISADMDLIGQLPPNWPTRFVRVDMDGALAARREEQARLTALREHLA